MGSINISMNSASTCFFKRTRNMFKNMFLLLFFSLTDTPPILKLRCLPNCRALPSRFQSVDSLPSMILFLAEAYALQNLPFPLFFLYFFLEYYIMDNWFDHLWLGIKSLIGIFFISSIFAPFCVLPYQINKNQQIFSVSYNQ